MPMPQEDLTLQELIVRALTGEDRRARLQLDSAAASDPELRQFCADLDEVVNVLAGSKEWRRQAPSPELTAKIRQAVVSKLPAAPPHFRKVMLEADLGRRRATRWVLMGIALFVIILCISWFARRESGARPKLEGKVVYEAALKGEALHGWARAGSGAWESSAGGMHVQDSEDPGALYIKDGFDAARPLAFEIESSIPELDERSTVLIFVADALGAPQPAFNPGARPARALTLEIGRDGLVLSSPDQALLFSRPVSNLSAHFYRVRLEYLGSWVRVLVNAEVFFEQDLPMPQGPLFPGVRVAGPQKNAVRFNAVRIER